MRETLTMERVVSLAEAGETFTLEAGDCPIEDLILLAKVVGTTRATVRFRGLDTWPIEDLMRITFASQGRVILERDRLKPVIAAPPRGGWFRRRTERAFRLKPSASRAA